MPSAEVLKRRLPQGTPQGTPQNRHSPIPRSSWVPWNSAFAGLAITAPCMDATVADGQEETAPKAKRHIPPPSSSSSSKRQRSEEPADQKPSPLENLPDEILSLVLGFAAEGCDTAGDVLNLLLSSRRICLLGSEASVIRRFPLRALQVAACSWSEPAQRFLVRCCQAGNAHACLAVGMIEFYCTGRPALGLRLLAQGAILHNPDCLYSLAIIHFNGSSGGKSNRDPAAGALLCMRAAELGHVAAMRELGHCLQDGFGVQRDPSRGMQLLVKANLFEAAVARATTQRSCNSPRCTHSSHEGNRPYQGECQRNTAQGTSGRRPGACSRSQSLPRSLSAPAAFPPSNPKCKAVASAFAFQGHNGNVPERGFINTWGAGRDEQPAGDRLHPSRCGDAHCAAQVSDRNMALPLSREQASSVCVEGIVAAKGMEATTTCCDAPQCRCVPSSVLTPDTLPDGWVRKFLVDWHAVVEFQQMVSFVDSSAGETAVDGDVPWNDLVQCSNKYCGRRELRVDEFRCCSACMDARYCSRVCQALDWKLGHKILCAQLAQFHNANDLVVDF